MSGIEQATDPAGTPLEYWYGDPEDGKVGRHEHPFEHLKADHDVRVFYPDWQVGYVSWTPAAEVEGGGYADVYDSNGTESGATEEAWCETCGAHFDPEVLGV